MYETAIRLANGNYPEAAMNLQLLRYRLKHQGINLNTASAATNEFERAPQGPLL